MTDTASGLKQRVVGACVVLSLAIIFLPMIFDQPHRLTQSPHPEIPAMPEYETVVIEKPREPQFEPMAVDPVDQRVKTVSEIVPAPEPASDGHAEPVPPVASTRQKNVIDSPEVHELPVFRNVWMVQLGTFSNRQNAYALRDRLRKDGFDAHTKPVKVGDTVAERVFSGPFVNRQEAERAKKKLDARHKVDSLILFFDP
jgi:DedD protein